MKLLKYLIEGNTLWDANDTYPEVITSDVKTAVTDYLGQLYGLRDIQRRIEAKASMLTDWEGDEVSLEDVIHNEILALVYANEYKYNTLAATEGFEYNPIENYNMVEAETTEDNKGQQVDTLLRGTSTTRTFANTDTTTHGEQILQTFNDTETTTHGETITRTLNTADGRTLNATVQSTTGSTEGQRTDTTSTSVYGFDSSSSVPSNSGQSVKGSQTNSGTATTGTQEAVTDTHTGTDTSAHSGQDTLGHSGTITDAHSGQDSVGHTGTIADANTGTDTSTSGTRKDTGKRDLTRSGNIGVTTTQQMIEQERRVAQFSFIKVIANDIKGLILEGVS